MVTDAWRRYFPAGSLDPRPDLHRMQAEWFAAALDRLEEPPLFPVGPQQPLVIRLLCLPTWRPACSVRVEPSGSSWRQSARELDGEESGFELGELSHREERLVVGADAERVAELWDYLRFWSLAPAGEDDALDGTTYVLEAAAHGRYRAVVRDEPEWGDTFREFSELLVRIARLAPR